MTTADLAQLKRKLANKRTAKPALEEFFATNPDAADALHASGINLNSPLLMLLLPILLRFLQDWLAKQKPA